MRTLLLVILLSLFALGCDPIHRVRKDLYSEGKFPADCVRSMLKTMKPTRTCLREGSEIYELSDDYVITLIGSSNLTIQAQRPGLGSRVAPKSLAEIESFSTKIEKYCELKSKPALLVETGFNRCSN